MTDPKHREPDLESPFLHEEIVGHIPAAPVADAFVASRLGGDHGSTFGTLGGSVGPDAVALLLERALRE